MKLQEKLDAAARYKGKPYMAIGRDVLTHSGVRLALAESPEIAERIVDCLNDDREATLREWGLVEPFTST